MEELPLPCVLNVHDVDRLLEAGEGPPSPMASTAAPPPDLDEDAASLDL